MQSPMYGSFLPAVHAVPDSDDTIVQRRRKRTRLCAASVAIFFAAGYAATYSKVVGNKEKDSSLLSSSSTSATLSIPSVDSAAFLQDDVSSLPEHIIQYLENSDSKAAAVLASGDPAAYTFDDSAVVMESYNFQTRDSPVESGEEYRYPWKYTAEPYKATTLAVDPESIAASLGWTASASSSSSSSSSSAAVWFKWLVDGHVQGYGSSVDVLFTELGEHEVVVAVKGSSGSSSSSSSSSSSEDEGYAHFVVFKVMVKYVRREIRRLADLDRESYFNAVQLMTKVPTEVGQTLYGPKYKSKDYFNRLHLYYGGTNDCDHWHAGAGFVTSHVTLTLEFEQAVQAIFPFLAQPYWDFTMESTFFDSREFRRSYIFSDSWFGDANPDNDLHTVTAGRWAFTPAMTDARSFSQVYNSYGLLRSPWNADPTPFLTRSMGIYGLENNLKPSGCSQYFVAAQKDSWMDLAHQLTAAAHGHIHETVGGAWNQDELLTQLAEEGTPTSAAVYNFAHAVQPLSKMFWRAGVTTCPAECAMDTASADCACDMDEDGAYATMAPVDVLEEAGVLPYLDFYDSDGNDFDAFYADDAKTEVIRDQFEGMTKKQTKKIYEDLVRILSKPGHIGDMFQATSTNDITFWVLHGTVDRLWHFKQLGNPKNYDATWTHNNTCYCHNPSDYQPFKNIFDVDEKYYTNAELVDLLAAGSDAMPYMYEHFSWAHCEFLGYNMDNSHFSYTGSMEDTSSSRRLGLSTEEQQRQRTPSAAAAAAAASIAVQTPAAALR